MIQSLLPVGLFDRTEDMPRQARKISESGIYHVVFRGVNHCHLFEEHEDFVRFLGIFETVKAGLAFEVPAFCLMSNHAHLLIKERSPGDIIIAMKRLLSPYAFWFNKKYQRSGALLANRYRSECVDSDGYLLTLVRYIHQNPLAAGIVKDLGAYEYSSYRDYAGAEGGLVDAGLVLGMFASDEAAAKRLFVEFNEAEEQRDCSLPERAGKSEGQARAAVIDALGGGQPSALCGLKRQERDAILMGLRRQGFSIRQLERVTGVSRGIIARAAKAD